MITKQEAIEIMKKYCTRETLVKHSIAVAAVMRGLASFFRADADKWEICGLLHDIDYSETENTPVRHGMVAAELLKDVDVPDDVVYAIKAHAYSVNGQAPLKNKIDFAIDSADAVSGLVIATALVYPDKKLASVKLKSISKRFKDKGFARNCDRERILSCEQVGISKEKLFELAMESLKTVSDELGV
jgi:hypothetical protein